MLDQSLSPTDATTVLRALARRLADSYLGHAEPRAMLLVGSAATGDADDYSDLDVLVYYDRVPPDESVAETPRELGAECYQGTPWSDESGEPDERGYSERYSLNEIECQVGHMSVGAFEREIKRLVVDHELDEELLKIMSGLFEGLPLVGEELIERWRQQAAYTGQLQRTTIEKRWISSLGGTSRRDCGQGTRPPGATTCSPSRPTASSECWRP
jgi:hypothetical protein